MTNNLDDTKIDNNIKTADSSAEIEDDNVVMILDFGEDAEKEEIVFTREEYELIERTADMKNMTMEDFINYSITTFINDSDNFEKYIEE